MPNLLVNYGTYKKIGGIPCNKHPDKGPIQHLCEHILKHDNEHNLTIIANQAHQLHKWLENDDIDKLLSKGANEVIGANYTVTTHFLSHCWFSSSNQYRFY